MSIKKKLILKISAILLLVLIICTFLSRTIYTMLLPEVKFEVVQNGTLNTSAEAKANFSYTNLKQIKAKDNLTIDEVKVAKWQRIIAKDVLYTSYVVKDDITIKKLQLALLQLQNQLIPNTLSDATRAEIEMQIKMVEQELSLYNEGVPYDKYFKEEQLKQNIKDIEEKILIANTITEQQTALSIELKIARDKLNAYLKDVSLSGTKDVAKEDELRLGVANVYAKLELINTSVKEKEKLDNQLKIALEQQNLYELTNEIKSKGEQEKLELSVLKLNNQLTQADISPEKINEIKLQIQIARKEIAQQKAKTATGGKAISEYNGIIANVLIKDGDAITSGQRIADITTKDSKQCVVFPMSFEAGNDYEVGSKVNVSFSIDDGKDFLGVAKKKEIIVDCKVSEKKYDEKNNAYIFTALIETKEKVTVETPVKIKLVKTSVPYEVVVSTSCLNREGNGDYFVLVIEERQGFFKKENYLKKIKVEVAEKNNLAVAIKSTSLFSRMKLVKYTSKPITDGDIVSVVN